MSYLLSKSTPIQLALLSGQTAGAGNVTFSFIGGDYNPNISTTTVYLEAGYEYSIYTSLTTSIDSTLNYNHIIMGVNKTSYPLGTTSASSGLDQLFDKVEATVETSFSIYVSDIITSNSRIEIWRSPL